VSNIFDGLADAGKSRPEHRCHRAVVKTDNRNVTPDRQVTVFDGTQCTDGHGVADTHQGGGRVCRSHQFFRQRVTRNYAVFGSRDEAGGGQPKSLHGSLPTLETVVANSRALREAQEGDSTMTKRGEVVDGLRSAACTVDVDPGVLWARDAPGTPEGYETSTLLDQPAGTYIAVMSVGKDEPVHGVAPQEVIKHPDLVVVVGGREGQHPITLGPSGVAQRMQEAVKDAPGAGIIAREQPATDHLGGAGTQRAGRLAGAVTQLIDGAEDLSERLGPQAMGGIGCIRDCLARHPGSFGDYLDRGPFFVAGQRLLHCNPERAVATAARSPVKTMNRTPWWLHLIVQKLYTLNVI
jgi:hypothetical protein